MNDTTFLFSTKEYKIYDLIKGCTCNLPSIIKITKGYYDDRNKQALCKNESFLLRSRDKQVRILARDQQSKYYYSIPKHYQGKFTSPGQCGIRNISDLVNLTQTPFNISPVDKIVRVNYKGDDKDIQIDELVVLKEYNDYYIKAHALVEGRMSSDVSIISRFNRAYATMAVGLQGHDEKTWAKYLQDTVNITEEFNYEKGVPNQDILVFPAYKVKYRERMEDDEDSTIEYVDYVEAATEAKWEEELTYQTISTVRLDQTPLPKPLNVVDEAQVQKEPRYVKHPGVKDRPILDVDKVVPKERIFVKQSSIKARPKLDLKNQKKEIPEKQSNEKQSTKEMPKGDFENKTPRDQKQLSVKDRSKSKKFATTKHIPLDISGLSRSDISECLQLLGLDHFVSAFRRDCIDGVMIQNMTKKMFIDDYQFSEAQATRLDMFVNEKWRPK